MSIALVAMPLSARAEENGIDSGDTAWMLISTALVIMMTVPGLILFYGGLVRKKNVLATFVQCFATCALASIVWMVAGYSFSFAEGNAFIGGFDRLFLTGLTVQATIGTIPESVFMIFQMAFAIITPALITGAYADRMKFSAMLVFNTLWILLVYAPVCHWVWGGGLLADGGVLDYAGGTVVHINAGVAGLVAALVIGKRLRYSSENFPPHSLVLSIVGAGLIEGNGAQVLQQLWGVIVTIGYCAIATWVMLKMIEKTIGLRVNEHAETIGLDISLHGQRGHEI